MMFDETTTRELTESIDQHLRSVPYKRYLMAMYAICEVLRDSYMRFLSAGDIDMIARSLELIDRCIREGPQEEAARRLSESWFQLLPDEDGPAGWFAAMYTISGVVCELAGLEPPQKAGNQWLPSAAKELPDPGSTEEPGLEQLDLYSPPIGRDAERLLVEVERIAREVGDG